MRSVGPAVAIIVAVLAYAATRVDWSHVVRMLVASDLRYASAATTLLLLNPLLTAAQWNAICSSGAVTHRLGYRRLVPPACTAYFWQTYVSPVVGFGFVLRRLIHRERWTIHQAAGLVAVDQIAEGASRVAFCGGVFLFVAASRQLPLHLIAIISAAAIFIAVLCGLAVRRVHANSPRLRLRARRLIRRLGILPDFDAMWTLRGFAACVLIAWLKKAIRIAAIFSAERAICGSASWGTAIVFLASLEGATVVPLTPGHLGIFEATAAAVYAGYGRSTEDGLAIGMLYHLALYAGALLAAILSKLVETRSVPTPGGNERRFEQRGDPDPR